MAAAYACWTGTALVEVSIRFIEAGLTTQRPPEAGGQVFAVYMAVNLGALALPQQLLWLDSRWASLFDVGRHSDLSVALMPVAATRLSQPVIGDTPGYLKTFVAARPWPALQSCSQGLADGRSGGLGAVYAGAWVIGYRADAGFVSLVIVARCAAAVDDGHVVCRVGPGVWRWPSSRRRGWRRLLMALFGPLGNGCCWLLRYLRRRLLRCSSGGGCASYRSPFGMTIFSRQRVFLRIVHAWVAAVLVRACRWLWRTSPVAYGFVLLPFDVRAVVVSIAFAAITLGQGSHCRQCCALYPMVRTSPRCWK